MASENDAGVGMAKQGYLQAEQGLKREGTSGVARPQSISDLLKSWNLSVESLRYR